MRVGGAQVHLDPEDDEWSRPAATRRWLDRGVPVWQWHMCQVMVANRVASVGLRAIGGAATVPATDVVASHR